MKHVQRYEKVFRVTGGGVTISGGEPLLQPSFVGRIFEFCADRGIPTALDTSGFLGMRATDRLLDHTSLVLLDVKSGLPDVDRETTRRDLEPTIVPTERVAVFGIGGLGHLAVQYARIMGGSVIAVDIENPKLELARELGAEDLVNAAELDPVAAIQELGGADVALVLAASPVVFEQAFSSLARGGRLICVALPKDEQMSVSIFETVLKGISIIGSIVGTRQDLAEVFALHAAGHTRIIAEGRTLDQVNDAIDEVLSGKVLARLVFEY